MKQSTVTLALTLATLLGGGLIVSSAASAHEVRSGHARDHYPTRVEHPERCDHRGDHKRGHKQGHKHDHRHGHKQSHTHVYITPRGHHRAEPRDVYGDVHRQIRRIYQPAVTVEREYRSHSPLRVEIGYKVLL